MPTPPVTDDYVNSAINANSPTYDPNLNKTQGVMLRQLVKDLRDSLPPIDSPELTGSPTAPTPTAGDNSTALATTAFVQNAVGSGSAIPATGNGLSEYALGTPPHQSHYIGLGGALTAPTDIDAGMAYQFRVGNVTGSAAMISVDPVNAQTQVIGGTSQLNVQQDNVELFMATAVYGTNKSIMLNDTATTITDNVNHKGFENAGDYEANFTARSLVTKQYVDGVTPTVDVLGTELTGFASGAGTVAATDTILQAIDKLDGNDALKAPLDSPAFTGTPTAPTPSESDNSTLVATTAFVKDTVTAGFAIPPAFNGLSILTTGSSPRAVNYIGLGGALIASTFIDNGTTYPFKVGDTGSVASVNIDPANAQVQVTGGASQLNLQQDNVQLSMATATAGNNKSIALTDTTMTVADNVTSKGLENAGDYEANFTARSLATKQYVDGSGALKAPLESPAFTGEVTINQADQPDVSTTVGTNAPAVLTVTGGAGGGTTYAGSEAIAGIGAPVYITSGMGGGSFGNAGMAVAGAGGDIAFSAGAGGVIAGTPTVAIPGNGGNVFFSAGEGGAAANAAGSGGFVSLTGGGGGGPNGSGGNVYFSPGSGNGTGINGAVYLNCASGGTSGDVKGNVVIGSNVDDNVNVLQVTGSAVISTLTARVNRRVLALSANSATPAVNTDTCDVVHITGQSAAITGFVMSGTPVDGDMLRISITGTAAVPFVLGGSFEPSGGVALSTTTAGTNRLDMGFVWNTETSKWRQIAVA